MVAAASAQCGDEATVDRSSATVVAGPPRWLEPGSATSEGGDEAAVEGTSEPVYGLLRDMKVWARLSQVDSLGGGVKGFSRFHTISSSELYAESV
jgi:hypothetical protein